MSVEDPVAPESEPIEVAPSITWASVLGFPAATAVLVGVVYGVGAYSRLRELSHAGVPVSVAFPLIPISQHLGRGLQVLLDPVLLVLVAFMVAAAAALEFEGSPPRKARPLTRRVVLGVLAVAALTMLVLAPLLLVDMVIGLVVVLLVLVIGVPPGGRMLVLRRRQPIKPTGALIFLAFVLSTGSFSVFGEWVSPAPLPDVTLQLVGQRSIEGRLIVLADGVWYVAAPRRRILAIDGREVSSAAITEPRRHDVLSESLF